MRKSIIKNIMANNHFKQFLALLFLFILHSGFSMHKKSINKDVSSRNESFQKTNAIDKIFTETVIYYSKAKKNNRELVHVVICATDAQGNLYKGFGPESAELFTNIFIPSNLNENVEINQFVVQGTDGYYGIWLQPGKKDKWRKGVYILGYRLKNATHQCAGVIKLEF